MGDNKRKKLKVADIVWTVFILFLAVGIIYPVIGIIALVCMLAPVVVGFFTKKRIWCSSYCPRGSFLGSLIKTISTRGRPPKLFYSSTFKNLFILFLLSNFAVGIIRAQGDLAQIGLVFVRLIIITSLVGIILGVFYQPRTWCTICPMGTLSTKAIKVRKNFSSKQKKEAIESKEDNPCHQCPLKEKHDQKNKV
ncbi:4Fe-4S binding protein [Natroniella sp. ANB-PHB2]|uniref:4Fe-4S binding protein n=1 Tax=Natroniella sp. ANB-PHB2 TaxID=3384444 RepID=UPI0038D38A75